MHRPPAAGSEIGSQMGSVLGSPPPSRYGSYELQHAPVQEESLMGTEGEWTSLGPFHNSCTTRDALQYFLQTVALQEPDRAPRALRVTGPHLETHGCRVVSSAMSC